MTDLGDLTDEQRATLTREFGYHRRLWGPRAALARELGIDPSTLQTLEGKRPGPVSGDMINRVTAKLGWPPDFWIGMATGRYTGPLDANQPEVDHRRPLRAVPTEDLERELALRKGSEDLPIAAMEERPGDTPPGQSEEPDA